MLWLWKLFNKHTKSHMINRYRLLILNEHKSHAILKFDKFCMNHSIILLYMSSHFSYLLQSLDVSYFSLLKKTYDQQIEFSMRLEINHVNKKDFLTNYMTIWEKIYKSIIIESKFYITSLILFNSQIILVCLHIQKTSTSSDIFHEFTSF